MSAAGPLSIVGHDADLDRLLPALAARGLRPQHHRAADPPPPAAAGILAAAATPALLRRWRTAGARCPILCLVRAEPAIAAALLAAGADGLLVPPLDADEITLRLAVARRNRPDRVVLDDRAIDLGTGQIERLDGAPMDDRRLTPTETRLLTMLAEAHGRPVPRADLLRRLWGLPSDSRALDNAVLRLRSKLEDEPRRPRYLLTAHRFGYRLRGGGAASSPPQALPTPTLGDTHAAARALLEEHRLVWLWGPAGVGKSHAAATLSGQAQPVWIPGVGIDDVDVLAVRIATALDLPMPAEQPAHRLGRGLAGRCAFIVLDGLDDLALSADARLLDALTRWQRAAPRCRFVATARRRLAVPGAHRLRPLTPSAAEALFLSAAARHGPLPETAAETARRVVARVGGLPQTLLLTAARLRYCSLETLSASLVAEDGCPPTDHGLGAALDRTWARLDPWRRQLARAAALFEGPFDLAELAAIRPVLDPLAPPLQHLLDELVDGALIESAAGQLRLLTAVRAAIIRRAAASPGLVERYARRRIEAAERAADDLITARAAAAGQTLARLQPDLEALAERIDLHPDLRARALLALGELRGQRRIVAGQADRLTAVAALDLSPFQAARVALQRARFLRLAGHPDRGSTVLSAQPAPPRTLAARWALERCWLAFRQARLDEAEAALAVGLRAAVRDDDRLTEGELLERAAAIARRRGQLSDADSACERSQQALRAVGAVWPALIVRGNQALIARARGDLETAREIWSTLIEHAEAVQHGGVALGARLNLGAALVDAGRHAAAEPHLQAAEAQAEAAGMPIRRLMGLYHRGRADLDRGRQAASLFAEVATSAEALGDTRLAAAATLWWAVCAHLEDDRGTAAERYRACGPALQRLGRELVPVWAFAWRRLDPTAAVIPEGPDPTVASALRRLESSPPAPVDDALAARSYAYRVAARLVTAAGVNPSRAAGPGRASPTGPHGSRR